MQQSIEYIFQWISSLFVFEIQGELSFMVCNARGASNSGCIRIFAFMQGAVSQRNTDSTGQAGNQQQVCPIPETVVSPAPSLPIFSGKL